MIAIAGFIAIFVAAYFLNLIFIVLSFVGIFLILGYLSSIPDKNISTSILPPQPPGFDENSSTEISS